MADNNKSLVSVSAADLITTIKSKLEICEADIIVFNAATQEPTLMRDDIASKLESTAEQMNHIRHLLSDLEDIEGIKELRT